MAKDKKPKLQTTYEFSRYSINALNGRRPIPCFLEYITGDRYEGCFDFHNKIDDLGSFLEDTDKDPYKNSNHEHKIENVEYRQTRSDGTLVLTWREFVKLGRPRTIIKTIENKVN